MANSATQGSWEDAQKNLFNKYMLPKVAFTIITLASLTGTYLAVDGQGIPTLTAAIHWLFLAAAGLTNGAIVWNSIYAQPAARLVDDPEALDYLVRQRRVFRRIEGPLLPVAMGAGVLDLILRTFLVAGNHPFRLWTGAAVLTLLAGVVYNEGRIRQGEQQPYLTHRDHISLLMSLSLIVLVGWLDVVPRLGIDWVQLTVRSFHLMAFSLWYGGALWNIFVSVPAAKGSTGFATVATANVQLERFRWVVRAAFPTIFITGLLQFYGYFGWNYAAALQTTFGIMVAVKLGLIGALVAVFITCPMWRACSPIRGVCNIDDLKAGRSHAAGGPVPIELNIPAD